MSTVNQNQPASGQAPMPPERLDAIRARLTAEGLTPGPWRLEYESCDCGGGYPCGHGSYPSTVVTDTPTSWAVERAARTGEDPKDYDFHRSEMGDFSSADWELMAHAREDVPALLAEVERLRVALSEATDTVAERDSEIGGWSAQVAKLEAENASVEAKTRESIAQDFIRQGKASDSLSWGQAVSIAREGLCACSGGIKPCDMGGAS